MTTPTPEAIEAALDACPGFAGWRHTSIDHRLRLIADMHTMLAAYESAMEAAGFVRVPVEPTSEMLSAPGELLAGDKHVAIGRAVCAWSAMIAARPSANKGERG